MQKEAKAMDMMKTGELLSRLRKERGMTQKQVAEVLQISDRTVSKWERGIALPDSSIMLEVCDILGISATELLCGERINMENYNKELENRKIKMIAVCPGWVKTEFFNRAVSDDTIKYYNKFFTSDEVVTRAIYDMYRGRDVSICGPTIRAQVLLTKLLPHKLVMKIWCKQQKK